MALHGLRHRQTRSRAGMLTCSAVGLALCALLAPLDFAVPPAERTTGSFTSRPAWGAAADQKGDNQGTLAVAASGSEASWSSQRTYFTGIAWYLAHFFVGIGNDSLMKYLGGTLPPFQIVFLRFLAAAAVLLPVMVIKGKDAFQSARIWMHVARGALLALGIGLWCMGLAAMPFASCVVINNTMPFFKMLFAKFILGETVGKGRWMASIGGFFGCLIVFNPTVATFKPESMVLILSAMCFAMLDIFNKKYATSESVVSMLFYGSVATAVVSAFRAYQTWVPVTAMQGLLFAALGMGANGLLYCLLKSFAYVDASATCPYRYTEFVLSAIIGFLVFREAPSSSTLLGSCIILPSVIYAAYEETRDSGSDESSAPEKAAPAEVAG